MNYKEIWKFPLEIADKFTLFLPKDAEIISMQAQDGNPMIWAIVDPDKRLQSESRTFEMVGTGHQLFELPQNLKRKFLGTFQVPAQDGHTGKPMILVFHVFEIVKT